MVVGLLVVGAAFAWVARNTYNAPGPLREAADVVVPRGSIDRLATFLEGEHLVNNATAFRIAAFLTRNQGPLRAGELQFPAEGSLRDVLAILRSGRLVQHKLTIPEGLTAAQVVWLFDRADAAEGTVDVPPEGSVLPETYLYDRGTPRSALVSRATRAMTRALDAAWAARTPDTPLANSHEALVLASIVERETALPQERARIAAVFLNRLRRGMKLQSDPTVAYTAAGGLGGLNHGLTRAELDRDTPYNTYRISGLPPDPICMPGLAALRAVTQPRPTLPGGEEYYFVADGSGGHVFARTEEEHNRNVVRWREIERLKAATRAVTPGAPQEPALAAPAEAE